MSKSILAAIGLMIVCATPAAAMDCGKMLDSHSSEINKMAKASPEKRAALTRMALSGYDSCIAGDMLNAERFFKMIMSQGN